MDDELEQDRLEENPGTDLCGTLRRTWNQFPEDPAATIAQAIDLALGVDKAKQILAELQKRDLSSDKVG